MIRDLKVSEYYYGGVLRGYHITGAYRMCSDSLWEGIFHNAVFRDIERADRMLERIKKVPSWNWKMQNWSTYSNNNCTNGMFTVL